MVKQEQEEEKKPKRRAAKSTSELEEEIIKSDPKPEKEKCKEIYAMTGNFGYMRALIPVVLRMVGLFRVRFVTKKVGTLLIGKCHGARELTEHY